MYFIDPDGMKSEDWIEQKNKDGTFSFTFRSDITTIEQAEAAGFKNVSSVFKSSTFRATDGSYSFKLGEYGSIKDQNGNFHSRVTTEAGSTISTNVASISQYKPKGWAAWEQGNFAQSFTYGVANSFYTTGQFFLGRQVPKPFATNYDNAYVNLNGSLTSSDEAVLNWTNVASYGLTGGGISSYSSSSLQILKSPIVFRDVSLTGLGQTTFRIGLRDKPTNTMIRLERDMMKAMSGPHYKATHINIHKPGSYNYHIKLNPLKWFK